MAQFGLFWTVLDCLLNVDERRGPFERYWMFYERWQVDMAFQKNCFCSLINFHLFIMEETRQDRIRRVSREWYARNKDRVRQRKLEQCHGYRRRLRAGRPPKAIKSMVFNINTGELTDLPIDETIITGKRTIKPEPEPEPDRTKIESGSFFVSFN